MSAPDLSDDPSLKNAPSSDRKKLNENLDVLYRVRFSQREAIAKSKIWEVLCADFFQEFIPPDSVILDLAAGYCDFINHIQGAKKYATDLNLDTPSFAKPEVTVFEVPSNNISCLPDESVDVVFTSNFLEHLKSKEEILETFSEVHRILKTNGRFMILQPNIRYVGFQYWDFFDQGLLIKKFKIEKVIPKFLPFTTKSKFPKHPLWVKLYLKIPLVWKILGKQSFLLVRK